jgi:hypothetical protein
MTKILPFLLLLSFIASGQNSSRKANPNRGNSAIQEWETFNGSDYSIRYPSNWELNDSEQMGTSLILFSPIEHSKDQFKENVNLIIQDLSAYNLDLDDFVELTLEQVKTMISNSTLVESKRINKADSEYHKLVYLGEQGMLKLKFEQYCWVINEKAYILTLTCERSKFPVYKATGEKILNSFLLTN